MQRVHENESRADELVSDLAHDVLQRAAVACVVESAVVFAVGDRCVRDSLQENAHVEVVEHRRRGTEQRCLATAVGALEDHHSACSASQHIAECTGKTRKTPDDRDVIARWHARSGDRGTVEKRDRAIVARSHEFVFVITMADT